MKTKLWEKLETQHFIFYSKPLSFAFQNIERLADEREQAFEELNKIFRVELLEQIRWFFFPSRDEGIKLLGSLNPGQAIPAALTIFTIYNEKEDSTPGHELVHILSFYWQNGFTSSYKFLSEGLARYLDKSRRDNHLEAKTLKDEGKLIPFAQIISPVDFKAQDSFITYRQSASFVGFLIENYGWQKFEKLWLIKNNLEDNLQEIYQKTLKEIEAEWKGFIDKKGLGQGSNNNHA